MPAVAKIVEKSRYSQTADLDVGVIYTHERHFIGPLFNSMSAAAGDLRVRLLLIDNASAEGIEPPQGKFWQSHVVRNTVRRGYGANLNRILACATAPYVLLMNTDMHFAPGEPCLAKMARFMDAHPDCGISICRLYHTDGTYAHPARRFQTPQIIAARRLGLGKLFPASIDRYLYRDRDPRTQFDCDWVSGCFMFLRLEAAQQTGKFDLRFVKYFEDVDYCARISQAGWRVMFNGDAYCYHHEQRASRRLLSADAGQHLRSYLRWLGKWGWRAPQGQTRAFVAANCS